MDIVLNELSEYTQVDTWIAFSKMTTLRIGGKAHYVVYPENLITLDAVIRIAKTHSLPFKLLGKGSNLLCSDADFEGIVIRLDRHFNNYYFAQTSVIAEAGCSIIALADACMKHSLSGLEFASGIPATVGGVTFMNAGAYKSSMSQVISRVFIYRNGVFEWIAGEECAFGYRTSVFHQHNDWIVLAIEVQLKPGNSEEIRSLMEDRRQRRISTQPLDKPSAGSVFHNPESVPAWKLIEDIGYRGHQIGGARVSDKHVNFIVNMDHATASDYNTLVSEIQKKVKEQFDIELELEVEKFNWQ